MLTQNIMNYSQTPLPLGKNKIYMVRVYLNYRVLLSNMPFRLIYLFIGQKNKVTLGAACNGAAVRLSKRSKARGGDQA